MSEYLTRVYPRVVPNAGRSRAVYSVPLPCGHSADIDWDRGERLVPCPECESPALVETVTPASREFRVKPARST